MRFISFSDRLNIFIARNVGALDIKDLTSSATSKLSFSMCVAWFSFVREYLVSLTWDRTPFTIGCKRWPTYLEILQVSQLTDISDGRQGYLFDEFSAAYTVLEFLG